MPCVLVSGGVTGGSYRIEDDPANNTSGQLHSMYGAISYSWPDESVKLKYTYDVLERVGQYTDTSHSFKVGIKF